MLEFLKAPFLVLHFSYYTLMIFLTIAIYADGATFYSKCDRESDLWQQFELASELESDLRDTADWGKKWLVDFNPGKTRLTLMVLLMGKWMSLFLRKNLLLR